MLNEMKIVVLITGGRTGSDLFQSLVDGHPEILTLPGVCFFDEFWASVDVSDSPIAISTKFCRAYPHFFDSRLNRVERHGMLGENRDEHFEVESAAFCSAFSEAMKDRRISKKSVLTCLHASYALASGEELSKKKVILLHLHHVYRLPVVADMDVDVLYTLRDPLVNLHSAVNNWLRNGESTFDSGSLVFHIDRLVNGIGDVLEYGKKTAVVQLENIHTRHRAVMTEFCEFYGIAFNECMAIPTYHGRRWWGDMISGRFLSGINPDFKNSIDMSDYFRGDVELLESALRPQLEAYGYPRRAATRRGARLSVFVPLKYELRLWGRAASLLCWKELIGIPVFWLRRIRALRKARSRRISWPRSIGSVPLA